MLRHKHRATDEPICALLGHKRLRGEGSVARRAPCRKHSALLCMKSRPRATAEAIRLSDREENLAFRDRTR